MVKLDLDVDLSILIVHMDGRSLLEQCLKSIYSNIKDLRIEVIVVFNGANDGSIDMCQQLFPGVIRVINQTNQGFCAGNNQGIKASKGRFIMLLNDDALLLNMSAQRMVRYLENNADVGMVGPKLLNTNNSVQRSCHHFPSLKGLLFNAFGLYLLFPRVRLFGWTNMTYWDYQDTLPIDWLAGACMLVKRRAIEQVGLLDTKSLVAGDLDWCWRFWKKGWKVEFIHNAKVIHLLGQSSLQYIGRDAVYRRAQRYLMDARALAGFFAEHHGQVQGLLSIMLIKLDSLVRLPLIFLLSTISCGEKGLNFHARRKGHWLILARKIGQDVS